MVGSKVALLLFGLAAVAAIPQPQERLNRPCWWPESLPWPPTRPDQWPGRPCWWPESLPWPPALPDQWPDRPCFWPDSFPWPPALPDQWPESIPWPPTLPEQWPDRPCFWPDSLPWPPALPDQWPNRPCWWPDSLPWPPAKPDQWPDRPCWWPDSLPWPPALPDQWPDQPSWWPDSLPWPPALPEEIPWPPPGVDLDRIPYIPSRDNQFHLFTRKNPSVSQPLVINNENLLAYSDFASRRRTVVLVHGYKDAVTSNFNSLLVPSFLSASDLNVIVVDWSEGANSNVYLSTFYSVLSGNFVARFARWLTESTGAELKDFHIVGIGLGALKAGFISRRLDSQVGYVTALDPSQGPSITALLPPLNPYVSQYTEVIHTDAGNRGYAQPLGDVDFYPNGGWYMPGCAGDSECNRNRAVYFFAESLVYGGFTGVECANHRDALDSNCDGAGRLNLGGLYPKTGSKGVFWVGVNASPPFSQG